MMEPTKLMELFSQQRLALTQEQAEQLNRYGDMLLDWNQRMNLTAITQPKEVAVKHFLDSALLLAHCGALPESLSLIDVGTGAGFPGLVLAVLKPVWSITLLDSLQKRVHFLETVCSELDLANVTCIHSRAEEGGQNPSLREQFDVATARAVANLPLLCEYCLPFVKVGGWFLPMKGTDPQAEGKRGEKAIRLLGGELKEIREYSLPDGSYRSLFQIKKVRQTPKQYPRNPGKIKKSPLG